MRAMILAAGRGERMRPLTDELPKPLLAAGGKPLIVWHIERLVNAGIRDIVINHAWLGRKIESTLGDGSSFGARIAYSAEGEALETAGGIARALPLLAKAGTTAEPFLLINGDTFCDFDHGRALTIALQMRHAALACWCVMVANPPHHPEGDFTLSGGRLGSAKVVDAAHRTPVRFTYSGIGLYTAAMFADVPPGKSPLRPWLEREIAAGRAAGEYHGGMWFDIGTPERLAELDRLLTT